MSFSPEVKERVFIASKRYCCLCEKFCGIKIEVHHIKQKFEDGQDTFENAIPLCFDCHADMRSYDHKHPKGSKYRESELIKRRDNWYAQAKNLTNTALTYMVSNHDRNVYPKLIGLLPWDGIIGQIRSHSFQGRIEYSFVDPIHDMQVNWEQDPAFFFEDVDVNNQFELLKESFSLLSRALAQKTFGASNGGSFCEVPPEYDRERYWESVNLLQTRARDVCFHYDQLVKLCVEKNLSC